MPKGQYDRSLAKPHPPPRRRSIIARFMEKVSPPDANGCRLFKINRNQVYGTFRIEAGEIIGAHVAAAIAYYGPVPEGMQVCHRCDVPACVNPAHLFYGTRSENAMDSVYKNRRPAKLTPEDVKAIRYLQVPTGLIADLYGINKSTVHAIKRRHRKHWAWVK